MSSSNGSHLQAAIKTRIAIASRTLLQVDDDVKTNWPKLLSAPAVKLFKIPIKFYFTPRIIATNPLFMSRLGNVPSQASRRKIQNHGNYRAVSQTF